MSRTGLVQQLVAKPAVEAFDERILLRFSGSDIVRLLTPARHRHAGQLGAVIGDTDDGFAEPGDNRVEFTADAEARQRCVGDQRQALAREIVDHCEDAETTAVAKLMVQEVERPALVRTLRRAERCSSPERPLAAAGTAQLLNSTF